MQLEARILQSIKKLLVFLTKKHLGERREKKSQHFTYHWLLRLYIAHFLDQKFRHRTMVVHLIKRIRWHKKDYRSHHVSMSDHFYNHLL